ncbi:Transposable element Tcb2 transposase [Folsomia candida]|uniref:Transposable element Tcb2 transposase n=1 Tax=Folsomia candida TaxID=158441 RepID=A0A226DUK9_FOLCA|nr:Transposable element Tcb2 transposase [Folsomia candida]
MSHKKEVSMEVRNKIVAYRENGLSFGKISDKVKISKTGVGGIISKWKNTGTVANRSGRGAKRKTTVRQDSAILRKVQVNPRLSAPKIVAEVKQEFGISVTPQTIRNRLNSAGLKGKVAKKKPWISSKNQRKRLAWAREKATWSIDDWKKVLFSDETKILLFGSDGITRVWRKPKEGLKKENLRPTVKHGGGNIIITP